MYEAILSDDGRYNIPDNFTARSAEILQVYLKTLGIKMETVYDDNERIAELDECNEVVPYEVGDTTIYCTMDEKYYLHRIHMIYRRYLKEHPNQIDEDITDVWEFIINNLTFKKKYLTDNIREIFNENIVAFSQEPME